MSKMRRHTKKDEVSQRAARAIKRRLVLTITALSGILLALMLEVGKAAWPLWLIQHRSQVAGILVLFIIVTILLSPILIEASSNTRTLSGPGKNPYIDP